jgi:hypothetical protein
MLKNKTLTAEGLRALEAGELASLLGVSRITIFRLARVGRILCFSPARASNSIHAKWPNWNGERDPSVYVEMPQRARPELQKTLKSHLRKPIRGGPVSSTRVHKCASEAHNSQKPTSGPSGSAWFNFRFARHPLTIDSRRFRFQFSANRLLWKPDHR